MQKLEEKILSTGTHFDSRFVPDYSELLKITNSLKKRGKKIVLTQGVFDLIHEGHALYLEQARQHGDVLMVGVDSDELTRLRKGPDRPVVPEGERIKMLVHLRHVDLVTLRHSHTNKGELINLIKPDVLIVSSSTKDFPKTMADEYKAVCGKVVMLPPQATVSTSARVRNLVIDGVGKLSKEINSLTEDFLSQIKRGSE